MFSALSSRKNIILSTIDLSSANALNLVNLVNRCLLFGKGLTHSHTMTHFDGFGKEAFRKHFWKRRNGLYKQFFLFPQCFLLCQTEIIIFVTFYLSSANAFNLVWLKIVLCGNGLKDIHVRNPLPDDNFKTLPN